MYCSRERFALTGDVVVETGRQALTYRSTEWGLCSRKKEERNLGRISQHIRIRARVTGPGVEGVNH